MNWLLFFMIPVIPCMLFPIVTFLRKKKLLKVQVMGNLTLLFFGFTLMLLAIFVTDSTTHSLSVHILYSIIALLVPSMVYLTVCSGTQEYGPTLLQRRIATVLPAVFIIGYIIILNFLGTNGFKVYVNQLFSGIDTDLELPVVYTWMRVWDYFVFRCINLIQTILFTVLIIRMLHHYRKEVEQINVQYGRRVKLMSLHMVVAGLLMASAIITMASSHYNQIYYHPGAMIAFVILVTLVTILMGIINTRMSFSAETIHKSQNL